VNIPGVSLRDAVRSECWTTISQAVAQEAQPLKAFRFLLLLLLLERLLLLVKLKNFFDGSNLVWFRYVFLPVEILRLLLGQSVFEAIQSLTISPSRTTFSPLIRNSPRGMSAYRFFAKRRSIVSCRTRLPEPIWLGRASNVAVFVCHTELIPTP